MPEVALKGQNWLLGATLGVLTRISRAPRIASVATSNVRYERDNAIKFDCCISAQKGSNLHANHAVAQHQARPFLGNYNASSERLIEPSRIGRFRRQ